MSNVFRDWARMYRSGQQYLESQGRPSSFLGQIADMPHRLHEAADASEFGVVMMRHAPLANRGGTPATVTVEGVWQIGAYMNMSPVLRLQVEVRRDDGTAPYGAVFDEVVAQINAERVRPGTTLAVHVDPADPADMTIDWIRSARL